MSVTLSIAFTGLCALVGDGDGRPGEILLLDARGVGRVQGVGLPAHAPTLVVSLNDLANPDSSNPTRVVASTPGPTGRVDQLGLWDLTGVEVRIRAQGGAGSGVQFFRPARGETTWPEAPRNANDPASWRDLRYIANMKSLVEDDRIDPTLVGDSTSVAGGLPRSIAARVHLDAGLLEGALPSQPTYRDEMFEFRSNGLTTGVPQALTDTLRWTLQSEAAAVVIEITPATGGPAERLLLAPRAAVHQVYVSNLPAENSEHAGAHGVADEMNALHFAAYYALLASEPQTKPLPQLFYSTDDPKGAGLIRPSFCPPAMFRRQ
jgi:hypothetical protein